MIDEHLPYKQQEAKVRVAIKRLFMKNDRAAVQTADGMVRLIAAVLARVSFDTTYRAAPMPTDLARYTIQYTCELLMKILTEHGSGSDALLDAVLDELDETPLLPPSET